MKNIYLTILCILFSITLPLTSFAQKAKCVISDNKAELSLHIEAAKMRTLTLKSLPPKQGMPLPEAQLYDLKVSIDTIGIWNTLSNNQKVWTLTINIPEADGFFLRFSDFYLPEGAMLYAYKKGELNEATVFTHEDNPRGGAYSIEDLRGDNVVLEYVANNNNDTPRLDFLNLGYKYTSGLTTDLDEFGHPQNKCMINANCAEGDFWRNQQKGVVRLRVIKNSGRTSLCSGTLINNTKNDKTPYILSAYHCFKNMTPDEIKNTEFLFEYESPECENIKPTYKYHPGCEVLMLSPIDTGSDGALLKLSQPVPDSWNVYYNGWNRENDGSKMTDGVIIHHPQGDVKKITFYNKKLASSEWRLNSSTSPTLPTDTHWEVNYSAGVTEGGSSGSPIFDQNGLVVGTLSGGSSNCTNPGGYDYYGKLWYHWDKGSNSDWHLNKYLDPDNTGVTKLAGLKAGEDNSDPVPEQQKELNVILSPNNLRIYGKDIFTKIKVTDLSGRVIYNKTTGFSSSVIDLPTVYWRRGVHVLSVSVKDRDSQTMKILK